MVVTELWVSPTLSLLALPYLLSPPNFTPSKFTPIFSTKSDFNHKTLEHANNEKSTISDEGGAGEALVACLLEVPSLYFKQDFHLEEGATFDAACPFSTSAEKMVLQENLSQYLDVVELSLVKELSLRSSSLFEAQGEFLDLNEKVVKAIARVHELKNMVRLIDSDLVESARQIQLLNGTRTNLLALQQKLKLISYVNHALSALKLFVASADCAGALDVTDVLQRLLDGDELTGLHCFRHLREHVTGSIESINSILSAEFIRASLHNAAESDVIILSKAKARASLPMNGKDVEVKLAEETTNFKDILLPTVVGLLRTAKLPSVLRIYRDKLTADMKSAINTAVSELFPVLAARDSESTYISGDRAVEADGGGASLASKLRSLSSECFVQLLSATFMIVQAHLLRAAGVKKATEWILSNCDGHYVSDSVAAAVAHGAAAAEIAQESEVNGTAILSYSPQGNVAQGPSFQGKAIDAVSSSNMSKKFRADVLEENEKAVFAACDTAHRIWVMLQKVRAVRYHSSFKPLEVLTIYSITQEFITAMENIGGRLGYNIQETVQPYAEAFARDLQGNASSMSIV